MVLAAKTPLKMELADVLFAFHVVVEPEQTFVDERNMAARLALTHEKFFFGEMFGREFGAEYVQCFSIHAETSHKIVDVGEIGRML